jgi:hypothetical protein
MNYVLFATQTLLLVPWLLWGPSSSTHQKDSDRRLLHHVTRNRLVHARFVLIEGSPLRAEAREAQCASEMKASEGIIR